MFKNMFAFERTVKGPLRYIMIALTVLENIIFWGLIAIIVAVIYSCSSLARAQGAPKMLICMESAWAAGNAFELKEAKKKLVYPKVDDAIFAAFVKMAMDKGYKAKSYEEAVKLGHDSCVNSKLWAEINN